MQSPILIAAGGTGGHIFPAEALAEVLLARGIPCVLVTDKRFAKFNHGVFTRIPTHTLLSGSPAGGMGKKITALLKISGGMLQARFLLWRLKPAAVIGFGGYPSFPSVFAAALSGIPTLVHEQNAVLGRANRWLAGKVKHIVTSFHTTLLIEPKDQAKIIFTGNPVRAAIRALASVPYSALPQGGIMQILVTGGSQGATVFADIVPAALAALPAATRSRIRIDQQCREADVSAVRAAYEQLGISANVSPFFIDMPARLASAHLVIARAGASTVAELAAAGRPAILVPYPKAADNHQYFNANAFEDAGAGWVMAQDGFTAAALAARIEAFINAPATLTTAASNALLLGKINAAELLADAVMLVAKKG